MDSITDVTNLLIFNTIFHHHALYIALYQEKNNTHFKHLGSVKAFKVNWKKIKKQ